MRVRCMLPELAAGGGAPRGGEGLGVVKRVEHDDGAAASD